MAELSANEIAVAAEEFLDSAYPLERAVRSLDSTDVDEDLLERVAELGWPGLVAPPQDDGLGLSPAALSPAFRVLGERLVAGPMIEYLFVPGFLLTRLREEKHAPAGVAGDVLRRAMTLETRLAVADTAAVQSPELDTGEVVLEDGVLHGVVPLVRFGRWADQLVVAAETDAGPRLVLVPACADGVTIDERSSLEPGSTYAQARFEHVAVTQDQILGADSHGVTQLRSWRRLLHASELTGIARRLHELTLGYVKEREQFGRTIGSFQAIKHLAADNIRHVVLMESYCEAVAQDAAAQSVELFDVATTSLKGAVSEKSRAVCENALQMHGGIGFTHEYELHWHYKRARGLRSWYGDERESAISVGRAVLAT